MFIALQRSLWRTLGLLRRLVSFLVRGSTILLICVLLLFNIATHTVAALNAAVSAAIETVAGVATVSAQLRSSLASAEMRASDLGADANKTRAALAIEKKKSTILAKKYAAVEIEARKLRVHGPDVKFRGKTRTLRSVAEEITGSVSRRTAKVAATNVGSMTGEGIPFWGIAVIVAATTLEVGAACETMIDMRDLRIALDPDADAGDDATEVCGMRVPTREEIWEAVKSSPGKAWAASTKIFSNLPSPDFGGLWAWAVAKLSWD